MQYAHLLLGVCDYPEHVPQDRWSKYARQQKELGLSFVRIAEFAWSRMEPRPGEYDWGWLDEAVDTYHAQGLQIVLCTPTPTPPAWLIRQHPEILAYDREGRIREFGSRRHYDFASPVFREHSRRITRAIAERYGQHPAVVGWQTDNEFACHDTGRSFGGASEAAFPGWLQQKYGTLDALNEAWGNVFWSMEYTDWGQIKAPALTVTEPNPSHVLDYYRFASSLIADFQAEQVALLRELSPGRFVTHNFMIFESGFDHYEVARALDFATWDNYPLGMLEYFAPPGSGEEVKTHFARTGHPDLISFNHDIYRGLMSGQDGLGREGKATPNGFWVMEQQCGQVNWAPWNPLPADGAVQLWTAQAWAHGADVVSYFRWRAATMAQEVMHSGLLRHDETPDRGFHEVKDLDLGTFPVTPERPQIALLHDYESLWIFDQQRHAANLSYWAQTLAFYRALRSLGLDVSIVHADADLSSYKLVVAPAITLMTSLRAERWQQAAESGVQFLCGPRTAFRTPSGQTWPQGQFGPLSDVLGAKLLQYDSMRPGLTQALIGPDGAQHTAEIWAESYRPQEAQTLYTYQGGPQDGQAAVIKNGNFTVSGVNAESVLVALLQDLCAGLDLPTERLPEGVRVSRRAGKQLIQNWNSEPTRYQGLALAPVSFEVRDA